MGSVYVQLFTRDIVPIFVDGFRIIGEKDRFNFVRCVPPSVTWCRGLHFSWCLGVTG